MLTKDMSHGPDVCLFPENTAEPSCGYEGSLHYFVPACHRALPWCRALAQKLGMPLLVVDAATLKLDTEELSGVREDGDRAGQVADDMFMPDRPGPSFPGDPFDLSGGASSKGGCS